MLWDGAERRKETPHLHNRIEDIIVGMEKLSVQLENYHSNAKTFREAMMDEMARIKLTLYGNGQQGLTSKVSQVENFREDLKNHAKAEMWLFGVVMTLVLSTLGWVIFKN